MSKPKFFNRYEYGSAVSVPTGSEFDRQYQIRYSADGSRTLRHVGDTNRYAVVQSHKDECLIENILARATLDPSVLMQRVGSYGDATVLPKSLMEMKNMVIRINEEFLQLDPDLRAKFGNSVDQFIAEYGNPDFMKKLGLVKEVPEVLPTAEMEVEADA